MKYLQSQVNKPKCKLIFIQIIKNTSHEDAESGGADVWQFLNLENYLSNSGKKEDSWQQFNSTGTVSNTDKNNRATNLFLK